MLEKQLELKAEEYYQGRDEIEEKEGFDNRFVQAKPAGTFLEGQQMTLLEEEMDRLERVKQKYY